MNVRLKRSETCNEFLRFVAGCGRRFFAHDGKVSAFEFNEAGHVCLRDKYSGKLVYTAYNGSWRGFTEGGTLRSLVQQMADYIRTGKPARTSLLGPWPDWYCKGDLWAYGDAMPAVRDKGLSLGIFVSPDGDMHD